jgi:hypothetical protein
MRAPVVEFVDFPTIKLPPIAMGLCERSTHATRKLKLKIENLKRIAMKTLLTLLVLATAIPSAVQAGYCAPYVTQTCVVDSRLVCRWATDCCGRPYSYHVRVVTYRNFYSNGQTGTFTKAYRA